MEYVATDRNEYIDNFSDSFNSSEESIILMYSLVSSTALCLFVVYKSCISKYISNICPWISLLSLCVGIIRATFRRVICKILKMSVLCNDGCVNLHTRHYVNS